ncbi:MAG: type I methionyl aminopeptidase [Planctomycetes bacterium]|nr:type I methionyl aminopeptidase [Planctomycetota bacterium]
MAEINLKSPLEVAKMRSAGRIVGETLQLLSEMVEPGISTKELDSAAADYIRAQGAKASFKGYRGFPASICTSVNEEIVHGIPGARRLKEGDLLKLDVGVALDGYHGDAAISVPVGSVSEEIERLMGATRDALSAGIAALKPGVRLREVCSSIQRTAEQRGYNVVRDYTGHGIGRELHEEPKVPNYVPRRVMWQGPVLEQGMALAIEPMLNAGTHRTKVLSDGWTVVTKDGRPSAHFEHTVAIDADGPIILTLS